MLRPDGQVLVADFGIAQLADTSTITTYTPGTPAYMLPEQCRDERVDRRTDVYAFGIVLYEMLTGWRPFEGELAPETVTGSTRERVRWEQLHAPLTTSVQSTGVRSTGTGNLQSLSQKSA